jgi:hypothetical protein
MPPGFHLEQGVVLDVDLSLAEYDEPRGRELFHRLTERLGALPGVEVVTLAQHVPYGHPSEPLIVLRDGVDCVDLRSALSKDLAFSPQCNVIGTDYFKALDAPLLRGRERRSSFPRRTELRLPGRALCAQRRR